MTFKYSHGRSTVKVQQQAAIPTHTRTLARQKVQRNDPTPQELTKPLPKQETPPATTPDADKSPKTGQK